MRHAVSLAALRGFEAFGRTGTLRLAGAELSVSPTVVSRHVHNLEVSLKVRLVHRSGRNLLLTEQGRLYLAELRRAFSIIDRATATLVQPRAAAPLHLCCTPGLAGRRLLSRLPELEARLGGREVTLQPTSARPDLRDPAIDAAIIYADDDSLGVADENSAERFFRPRVLAVSSARFQVEHPEVESPRDLTGLPLLFEQTTRQWQMWFEAVGIHEMPLHKVRRLWNSQLTIEAAKLDQGVALASELLFDADCTDAKLVEILPTRVFLGAYYFVARKARLHDPDIVILRDWVVQVCSRDGHAT